MKNNHINMACRLIFIGFLFFIQFSLFSQDCTITSKANDMIPDKLCAPVSLSWEVTYRGVNDGGTLVQVRFNWDDGNPVQVVNAVSTNPALKEWKATVNHVYPKGGSQCNYNPNATLVVNGVICTSSIQEQNVTVWDTDDENGGAVQINPQVFPICVGNSGTVTFEDVTQFNCVPPLENDVPNTATRWTQWIYGTNYTINNVQVNGSVQAYPYYDAVVVHPGAVTGPTPTNDFSFPCFSPATATVGQFFELTLRYWNYCNPYDDPNIPGPPLDLLNGDNAPVTNTAIILIVPKPDATINPAGPFCSNAANVNLTAATPGGTWSGTGIINAATGRFSPSTAGPGSHVITYTITDGNGCTSTDTETIIVWARPTINILPSSPAEVCPGDSLLIDGNPTAGSGNITTHLWTGPGGLLTNYNIQAPYFYTTSQGSYAFTYRVTDDNGCWRTANITVNVNPVDANILPIPAEACKGKDFQLLGNPSGGTGNYTLHSWTIDSLYLNNPNIQNPVFNTSVIGNYTLAYYVSDNNGCIGFDTINVNVFDVPVSNAGVNDSICGNTYNLSAIPSIGSGLWTKVSGPGNASFSNPSNPNSSVSVSLYGAYMFKWKETFGPNCSDSSDVKIVFIEKPNANAGLNDNICGLDIQLNAIPSVGVGNWQLISGTGITNFSNENLFNSNFTSDTYGQYVLLWTEDNAFGCVDSDTVIINFDVVPIPDFSPVNAVGCSPFTIQFIDNSVGAVNYSWNFGTNSYSTSQNPTYTYINSTTNNIVFNVKLVAESMYGCRDSITTNVTVYPIPNSNFTHDASPQCSPLIVNFSNSSTGSVLHLWDYKDGSAIDTIFENSHLFTNDTTFIQYFNVSLISISNNGCRDTLNNIVTVYPNPKCDFTIEPDSVCHPAIVNFLSTPGSQVYKWNFGDGIVLNGQYFTSHNYYNTGTSDSLYVVKLVTTSFFGCKDSSEHSLIVYPKPDANFYLDTNVGCSPFLVKINYNSILSDNYYWNFGNGQSDTTSQNYFEYTYLNNISSPIINNLQLITESVNGCKDTLSIPITIYPSVKSNFVCDTIGCEPLSLQFINQSAGTINYYWDFGNSNISIQVNPQQTFNVNGYVDTTYVVKLISSSIYGCIDSSYKSIRVLPKPLANFYPDTISGCSPFTANIINLSQGADSLIWGFGDGVLSNQMDSIILHTYFNNLSSPSEFQIGLTAINNYGCFDDILKPVIIYPNINADFTSDTIGCHPLNVQFVNLSYGQSINFWDFGDGALSSNLNPLKLYNNVLQTDTIFVAKLVVTSIYNCKDSITRNIHILPKPIAHFTTDTLNGCSPFVANFYNNSLGADTSIWNFGNGISINSNDSSISNLYVNNQSTATNYNVSLNIKNSYGCIDSYINTVTVYPEINADFVSDTAGCSPYNVQFTNLSSGANSYNWSFGDGNSSEQKNPLHTYINNSDNNINYIVVLNSISQYGCSDSAKFIITTYPTPIADFSVSPISQVFPNSTVNIINNNINPLYSYYWTFGDGSSASVPSVNNHTYSNWGDYNITLKVSYLMCYDSLIKEVKIIPTPPEAIFDSSAQGCPPLHVQFNNYSTNSSSYYWEFGDGNTSSEHSPSHTYNISGNYNVKLTVTGPGGEDVATGVSIEVYLEPKAYFTLYPKVIYLPDEPLKCYNLSSNAEFYIWNFGDGDTSNLKNPEHYYNDEGVYPVSLIAISDKGCIDSYESPDVVTALVGGRIIYPNAFTPNPNGGNGGFYDKFDFSNDVFFPIYDGIEEYHLQIYNRWGELLFESFDLKVGWDGYYKGNLCKQDVYVWKVKGRYINGKEFIKTGDLTLIR